MSAGSQVQWDDTPKQGKGGGTDGGSDAAGVTWDDDPEALAKHTTPKETDSAVGGFVQRGVQTAKGLWDTVTAPPQGAVETALPPGALQAYRVGKGMVSTAARAGKQSFEQAGQAGAALRAGYPIEAGLKAAQSFVTGASALDPFATGTVADVNELEAKGKGREALGTAAFDTLLLLAGGRAAKDSPASAMGKKAVARLTGAIGETGETAANLKPVLPDIVDTVQQMGKRPGTVGELRQVVQATTDRFETEFNTAMQPVRYKQVMPSQVANDLLSKITPNMAKTAAGQAEAAAIRDAALEFQKPWTINELNAERAARNAELQSFYNKGSGGQTAAMKSRVSTLIDKTVRDAAADIVYDEIGKANKGLDVRALKMKERSLWSLRDQMDKRIGDLEDKQLAREGRSAWEKIHVGTYASPGRMHGYISGLSELVPGGGPETFANAKVTKAFRGASPARMAARGVILAMPLARLGGDKGGRKLTPPPDQSQ